MLSGRIVNNSCKKWLTDTLDTAWPRGKAAPRPARPRRCPAAWLACPSVCLGPVWREEVAVYFDSKVIKRWWPKMSHRFRHLTIKSHNGSQISMPRWSVWMKTCICLAAGSERRWLQQWMWSCASVYVARQEWSDLVVKCLIEGKLHPPTQMMEVTVM